MIEGIRRDLDALAAVLRDVPEDGFTIPTPCAAWDLQHLVAHLYRDFHRILDAVEAQTDAEPDTDRYSYWNYDRDVNQATTQQRAKEIVADFESATALAEAFVVLGHRALDVAIRTPGDTVVRTTWGPVMRFEEFLATRWVELAVHSLDVTDALGRSPVVSDEGLAFTADALGLSLADCIRWHTGRTGDSSRIL